MLQCRLILGLEIITSMRPTELAFLELGQYRNTTLKGTSAYIAKGKLGAINGTSKTRKEVPEKSNTRRKKSQYWILISSMDKSMFIPTSINTCR